MKGKGDMHAKTTGEGEGIREGGRGHGDEEGGVVDADMIHVVGMVCDFVALMQLHGCITVQFCCS